MQLVAAAVVVAALGIGSSWYSSVLALLCIIVAGVLAVLSSVRFLGKDEQLRVVRFTETTVHNGPQTIVLPPFTYRSAEVIRASSLGEMDYLKIKDKVAGNVKVVRGPKLLFLDAYEQISASGTGVTLTKTEYLIVEDQMSGESRTVKGPTVWFPAEYESITGKRTAIALQEDEYIRISDSSTGQRKVQQGKCLFFPEPTQKVEGGVRKAWTLQANEYVRLLDSVSGKITVHRGESTVFPAPHEELLDGDKMEAIELKVDEYVKIMNQTNGEIRVASGPVLVFLGANDKVLDNGKKKAVQVDDQVAVLVRDLSTGQLRLVKEKKLYVPGANEVVDDVRPLVMLADHEAIIIKDKDGILHFHYGDPAKADADHPRSFFVPPHAEVVELQWSGGLRRAKRDLKIKRFDCRPQFMWNEIDCRTKDNVELVLETTLFWEAMDLAQMVKQTGNLPGDIYNQLRSLFIKYVAQHSLKEFMSSLHIISKTIFDEDPAFFTARGVKIHSLNVTKYCCAEKRTSEILQQIIEESTNRLNRLSQAESENEVKIFKMQGQIEQEKLNGELLDIQHEHSKNEAQVGGQSEAERSAAFLKCLEKEVPKLEDRMHMWQVLRKTDALSVISTGGASLFYTPNDVNLSIKTDGSSAKAEDF